MLISLKLFVAALTSADDSIEYIMGIYVNESEAIEKLKQQESITKKDINDEPINRITVHWVDIKI